MAARQILGPPLAFLVLGAILVFALRSRPSDAADAPPAAVGTAATAPEEDAKPEAPPGTLAWANWHGEAAIDDEAPDGGIVDLDAPVKEELPEKVRERMEGGLRGLEVAWPGGR